MEVNRTFDYGLVRSIMTSPRVYPHIIDDFSPSAEEFRPIRDDRLIYLAVSDESEVRGAFLFVPENGVLFRVHHFLLPVLWGSKAIAAARLAMTWIWENTDCQRISGKTPTCNRLAWKFAEKVGMKTVGYEPNSVQIGGKLYAQIITGMNRPEAV